jgi:hypothetical protein
MSQTIMRLIDKLFHRSRSHDSADQGAPALVPPTHIDYAEMERAFLAEGHVIARTETGALCQRHLSDAPGPAYYWRSVPPDLVARFVRRFLTERGQTHLWTSTLASELAEYMRLSAERHRPSERFLAG